MILQALKEYYDRKAADPESDIAPEGWEKKEIPFIVVIDRKGDFITIEDTREGEGKNRRAKIFDVPQGVKKTSGIAANLLWDSAGYIFGIDNKGKPERAIEQKKQFVFRLKNELADVPEVQAIIHFLENLDIERLQKESSWAEITEKNPNVSFRYSDEHMLICQNNAIKKALVKKNGDKKPESICMITGESAPVAPLHPSIKGVWGAQSSGANIVSFNLDSFRSFGKEQGFNAPIGEYGVFAYTTALNTLLGKDSKQKITIGDATTVFWSAKKSTLEADFVAIFAEPPKDDPDAGTRRIKALFESVTNGAFINDEGKSLFFVLGLAPNAARIAIRFWQVGTVTEFAEQIMRHFDDLSIVKPPREPEHYSIWRLLVNVASQDKSENIPPNVAGDFMRSILTGVPYPATLLQAALRRIHSDTENRVKPVRAALIKAYLNRYHRIHINPNHKELLMSLDENQPSVGYQLGRLFAALEKIQEEANPALNVTIRERYYGAACANPVTVFANLMRLKNHHLAKFDNKGRVINFEKLLAEIISHFDEFPGHLDLHEQGRFAVGYYHQRQDFFTKKEESTEK